MLRLHMCCISFDKKVCPFQSSIFLENCYLFNMFFPLLVIGWCVCVAGLTPETSSSSAVASPRSPISLESNSPRNSSSTSDNCQSRDVDWVDTFMVPWDKFPEELLQSLERGKRPNPRMRREMVRIVVSVMMQKRSSINKRSATEVAKKMVAKYPKSLQDIIEGDVIGAAYHSLVKQLQNRIENVRLSSTPKIRKRKHHSGSDTDKVPPEKRAAVQDTYGCVNWNVKFLPIGETPESQQEHQEKLKIMFQQTDVNPVEVKRLMKLTFYTQRKKINQGQNIKNLLEEWPFLFEEHGMAVHFQELTGVRLKEVFTRNLQEKGKRLLNYMNTVCVNKSRKFQQAVTKYQVMRGEVSGCSEDLKDMLLLLLSYFDEKEDAMICYVEDTCLAGEAQMDQVPLTPTIVVCGKLKKNIGFSLILPFCISLFLSFQISIFT